MHESERKTDYRDLLQRFTEKSAEIFGDNLTGIYLHGSAAMGCFQARNERLCPFVGTEDEGPGEPGVGFLWRVQKRPEGL